MPESAQQLGINSLKISARVVLSTLFACAFCLLLTANGRVVASTNGLAVKDSQGCVNQGADRRVAAPFICWAQRHLSWKSSEPPHFWLIGNPARTSVGLAWPPYLVYNSPGRKGWHMFRIGFRYDRNWHGYIFPTIAWKRVATPLRY